MSVFNTCSGQISENTLNVNAELSREWVKLIGTGCTYGQSYRINVVHLVETDVS